MSEPLSSIEIEDVLSSIRRLVSEDLRPAARNPAPAAVAPAADAGKLLLTPALRVVDQPAVVVAPAKPVTPAAFADTYDDAGLDEGDSGLNALLGTVSPPDEAVSASAWDETADETVATMVESSTVLEMADQGDDLFWAEPGVPEAEFADDIVEAAVSPAPPVEEVIGHWTAEEVPSVDWAQDDAEWAAEEPVPFVAHPRKTVFAEAASVWADVPVPEEPKEVKSRVVRPPQPAPEPEAPKKPAEAVPDEPGLFDADTSEIDEEMLRDIVRDIIREELAGTLGERITRNVRKLVRVEINRALSAREFE